MSAVDREQFDDLPNDLGFLLDRLITSGLELPEQVADFLVISLQHNDGIR
jgi:hypothetical protein